ncbi:hypothetical protein [Kribbella sp. NPDC006257]|uniref:hypothetical protein n=1 Tax=Kribbella sp. NPDC006257 TaxID=3156738 RepID=UPI00339E0F4C
MLADEADQADESGESGSPEQWLVPDPRITPAQAAAILGLEVWQVHRLMDLGRLPKHGRPGTTRQLLLSDVKRLRDLGEQITLREAARFLHCTIAEVRQHIAAGRLITAARARRPVYRSDVDKLVHALGLPPPRSRPGQPPTGFVDTAAAARILGRSESRVRQLATDGRLPTWKDNSGRYWFRQDQVALVRKAWDAVAARRQPGP